jgi:hypothetical protein
MRAHGAIHIVYVCPRRSQKAASESTFSIILVDNQLSDPTDSTVVTLPTTDKSVPG